MSSNKVFGKGSSKNGKYGGMRDLQNAKRAGRSLRMAPAAAVQASVVRAEKAIAMKNAGFVDGAAVAVTGTVVQYPAVVFASLGGNAQIYQIGVVPQNTTINGRIGAKLLWKSIQMRFTIGPGSAQTVAQRVSLCLVYDRYPQNAVAGQGDIFSLDNATSLLNDANRKRFAIVRRFDWMIGPAAGNNGLVPQSVYAVDEYIKTKGLSAEYKGDAGQGGMADIRTGALYLVALGSIPLVANTVPEIKSLSIRVRFADLQG
jgi:hypothetical protein